MKITRECFEAKACREFASIAKCSDTNGITAQYIKATLYGIFDDELVARRVYMEYTRYNNPNNKFRFMEKGNGQYIVAIDDIKLEFEE